ncbi:hypothetical protein Q3G72_015796 [Acer saccharum]|nr:hypothetical protein Q3G72_015796 [Acer saccharum]
MIGDYVSACCDFSSVNKGLKKHSDSQQVWVALVLESIKLSVDAAWNVGLLVGPVLSLNPTENPKTTTTTTTITTIEEA